MTNAANISMAMHEIDQSDKELNDDPSGALHSLACKVSQNIQCDNIQRALSRRLWSENLYSS